MHFNIQIPTDPVSAIIPVTQGCDVSFTLDQLATADNRKQSPVNFQVGDTVTMTIEINRTTTLRIDAILDANTASFTIPAETADDSASNWCGDLGSKLPGRSPPG